MTSLLSRWTTCAVLVMTTACSRSDELRSELHPYVCADKASCGLGFEFAGTDYNVICTPVKESAVDPVVVDRGTLNGGSVELHRLVGVDEHVLMTISTPGGGVCASDPWVIVQPFPLPDSEALRLAYCTSVDLEKASGVQPDCNDR
jgi:hypothetical protein